MDDDFKFRNLKELISAIAEPYATANGIRHERGKAELDAKIANEICKTIDSLKIAIIESSKTNDKLGKKIYWLNIILAIATFIGAIATAFIAYKT